MKTFAAINVGSYEQTLKIYTITKNNGIREVDWIRNRLDLGGTFATGKLSHEVMDELCAVLRNFVSIMEGYRVDDYRACATSAIRETKNTAIVLDQIMQRTGVKLDVLSNSEQRFLDYKSIASRGGFEKSSKKEPLFWISAAAAFRCHCLIRISFPRRRTCALAFCGCRKK